MANRWRYSDTGRSCLASCGAPSPAVYELSLAECVEIPLSISVPAGKTYQSLLLCRTPRFDLASGGCPSPGRSPHRGIHIPRSPRQRQSGDQANPTLNISRIASLQPQRDVQALPLAEDGVRDPVANLIVQSDIRGKLPGGQLGRFAVDGDDDIVLPDAGLLGWAGHERPLAEGELLLS